MVTIALLAACIPEPGASAFDPDHDWDSDGVTENEGDCDDEDASRSPLLAEVCSGEADEDCDGEALACAVQGEMSVQDGVTSFTDRWEDDTFPVTAAGDLSGDGSAWAVTGALGGHVVTAWRFVEDGARMRAEGVWMGTAGTAGVASRGAGADVDGDGIGDLLVGVAHPFNVDVGRGGLFVTMGPVVEDHRDLAVDPRTCEIWAPDGESVGVGLGSAGDLDGDGDDDFLAGGPGALDRSGTVYWLAGDPSWADCNDLVVDIADVAAGQWQGSYGSDYGAGVVTGGIGDADGDGLDDVVVGTIGTPEKGMEVFLVLGAPDGLSGTRPLADVADANYGTIRDGSTTMYGISFSPVGDLDGDGKADLGVGTVGDPTYEQGAAWIVLGAPLGEEVALSDTAQVEIGGIDRTFGAYLTAGDLDGDGISELLVGSPEEDDETVEDAGAVYVFLGSQLRAGGEFYADQHAWAALRGTVAYARAGRSLAVIGDVDRDGDDDFAVGELLGSDGTTWLFLGGS
jgi:hypothetical protein